MALGKKDNPAADKGNRGRSDEARDPNRPIDPITGEKEGLGPRTATPQETEEAIQSITDSSAGAPDAQREAAAELPEGDAVKDATKASLLAEDAQTEAEEKAKVVEDSSTGAAETPSGSALLKTADIEDNVERGRAYEREKAKARWGTVPAEEE